MSIKVALVGYGRGFNPRQYHCSAIKNARGMTLYGCCDCDDERRQEARKEFQVKTYCDFEEVLADPSVDLVVIATPNTMHSSMAIRALEAGKHVVVEKIMSMTVAEADAMIEAAVRNGRLLTVRQNRRWDTDFLTVKQVMESGEIGEVFSIDSSINMFIKPGGWRANKEMGGGFFYDWGAHLVDQVLMLVPSDPETVFAVMEHRVWNAEVDSHARVLIKFREGPVAEVETSNISWISRPRWHVRGEKGACVYQGGRARVKTADGEKEIPNVTGNLNEFYQNVADALNEGVEIIVKPEEVRKSIAVIEAAVLSAERGESVRIKL